jgi:hypothetical protein
MRSQAWWKSPSLRRQKQEDCDYKASQGTYQESVSKIFINQVPEENTCNSS